MTKDDPCPCLVLLLTLCSMTQGAFTGVATSPGPGYLLNRDHIRGNVSELAESVTQLKPYGLPVIMGETNSAARHGIPGVSGTCRVKEGCPYTGAAFG